MDSGCEEVDDHCRDLLRMGLEREVARIKEIDKGMHIIVDDLPWWWADTSDSNTVDIANFPPGQHKVTIQLVDANHNVIAGQTKTLTFTIPKGASHSH